MNYNYKGKFLDINYNKELSDLSNSIVISKNKEILDILKKQLEYIQKMGQKIFEDSKLNFELNDIKMNFKKSVGQTYFLYEKNNKKYLSLISPEEWNSKDKYLGCYMIRGDLTWEKCISQ